MGEQNDVGRQEEETRWAWPEEGRDGEGKVCGDK